MEQIQEGMHVRIYRNLKAHLPTWSIQTKTAKGWRVFCHVDQGTIKGVTVHATEAGKRRIIKRGKRTVVAWMEGDVKSLGCSPDFEGERIRYLAGERPDFFWSSDGETFHGAPIVGFTSDGSCLAYV